MLLAKQWSRLAACIIALVVFTFVLSALDIVNPDPRLLNVAFLRLGRPLHTDQTAKSTHRPQEEDQPATATYGAHHVYLEGTRIPDATPKDTTPSSSTASASSLAANPTSTAFRKAVVVGKLFEEDTQWVVGMQDKGWEHAIYVVDLSPNATSPTGLKTKMNKAKETMPYLTYLVEHYDNFPDVAVFMHSHQNGWPAAWHNDAEGYEATSLLNELRLDTVEKRGFVNLRCLTDPGCPAEIILNRNPPDESREAEVGFPTIYGQFFNVTVEQVRKQVPVVATPCCAQFAVSRQQVLKRPKSEYERFVTLIEESEYDDNTLGTIMEYMWHIMFGRDPVMCEAVEVCYSEIYNRPKGWSNWNQGR